MENVGSSSAANAIIRSLVITC